VSGLELMLPPFVACMILVAMLSYLGLHVIAREVIFVDLSLAQMAALGSLSALLFHVSPDSPLTYVFALLMTAVGAFLFALTRSSVHGGSGAATYGTAPIGPDELTEVVTFGLVTASAPDGAPVVIGIDIPAHAAAAMTLSLYTGAFYAEIIRGGVNSIERGQWDAARAIGMRRGQVMRRVILPQAIKRMIPPFMNQSIMQLKNTSLVSTIAVSDLLYQGEIITATTYRPLEVYTVVALIYFGVLFPLTLVAQQIEKRLAVSD